MFMSIDDVTQRTKLSESSIRRLLKRGLFPEPIVLIGRKRVWSERAVTDWMNEKLGVTGVRGES